jgi:acyl transferase domain-containing protein
MASSRWDEIESAAARQPVAVVGIALKFPQDVSSAEDFWQMLMNGRCAATGIPKERMNADTFHGSGENNFDTVRQSKHHPEMATE